MWGVGPGRAKTGELGGYPDPFLQADLNGHPGFQPWPISGVKSDIEAEAGRDTDVGGCTGTLAPIEDALGGLGQKLGQTNTEDLQLQCHLPPAVHGTSSPPAPSVTTLRVYAPKHWGRKLRHAAPLLKLPLHNPGGMSCRQPLVGGGFVGSHLVAWGTGEAGQGQGLGSRRRGVVVRADARAGEGVSSGEGTPAGVP